MALSRDVSASPHCPLVSAYGVAFLLGLAMAAAALASSALLRVLVPARPVPLAGDGLFAQAHPALILLIVVLWAPLFETFVAQVLPVAVLRRCTKRRAAWIGASALLFASGHVFAGGGVAQAMLTFAGGTVFAAAYVHWLPLGAWHPFAAVALAHGVNNGTLFAISAVAGA